MHTAGKLLIFSAIGLRAVVIISDDPEFRVVIALLAAYGLFLITETWMIHRRHPWFVNSRKAQLFYLSLQSLLVLGLLIVCEIGGGMVSNTSIENH